MYPWVWSTGGVTGASVVLGVCDPVGLVEGLLVGALVGAGAGEIDGCGTILAMGLFVGLLIDGESVGVGFIVGLSVAVVALPLQFM